MCSVADQEKELLYELEDLFLDFFLRITLILMATTSFIYRIFFSFLVSQVVFTMEPRLSI